MKLTITTLVIIEDTSDNCNELNLCYHSFQEDPNRAKSETLPGHLKRICSVDKISLANFLNDINQVYQCTVTT